METKTFSSSGFSHKCTPEELYVLTRHWLSDILFFEQEIIYLKTLIQVFLLPASGPEDQATVRQLESKLDELQRRKEFLKENIISHQNELSLILDKNHTEKQLYYNVVQSKLEGEIFDFIKAYRIVKVELFTVTPTLKKIKAERKIA